jgi:protein N-terminal methyltransferase
VLGGFGSISDIDTQSSKTFLSSQFPILSQEEQTKDLKIAADCGAGIGRVSKDFLLHHFGHVDLVEQNPDFLDQASSYIGLDSASKRITCTPKGLQDFYPEQNRYDLIWCQWVLGHLKDGESSSFFNRRDHYNFQNE